MICVVNFIRMHCCEISREYLLFTEQKTVEMHTAADSCKPTYTKVCFTGEKIKLCQELCIYEISLTFNRLGYDSDS